MRVAPFEAERVASDLLDIAQLEIAAGLEARFELASGNEADRPRVALATGAGAIPAQDFVRINSAVTVGPGDFHGAGVAGRFDVRGVSAQIGLHCAHHGHGGAALSSGA